MKEIKDKMKCWLDRNTPPGIEWKMTLNYVGWVAIFGTLWSLSFFVTYNNHYNQLFETWRNGTRVLREGTVMTDFVDLIDGKLLLFHIITVAMILLIGYHYNYYHQGSKSIYLMKRLPKRSELWRRCLVLPVTLALTSEAAATILRLLFFAYYMARTPEACLAPGQWIW